MTILFWVFQVVTGISSLAMFLAPKRVHESLVPNPQQTYATIGFSKVAVEMVHNVIRGQGAALLAIVIFLFLLGPANRDSYKLIAIASLLTGLTHVMTANHHRRSPVVMAAVGTLKQIYGMIALNAFFAIGAMYFAFFHLS